MASSLAKTLTLVLALFVGSSSMVLAQSASPELTATMRAINTLNAEALTSVTSWAQNPNSNFDGLSTKTGLVEEAITLLPADDEFAIRSWFSGNGRAALRARGLTDVVIGPARSGIDLWGDAPWGAVVTESGQFVVTEDGKIIVTERPIPCFADSKIGAADDGHCFTDYHAQQ